MPSLFDPLRVGDLELPNRVIMAPLTRCRASEGRVPNDLMHQYYVQRANAGMILTEATAVSPMGVGYPNTPGIWSKEQVEGWADITKGVHEAGGRILLQLWHVGRISDPSYLHGKLPLAPSAIAAEGHIHLLRPVKYFTTPRALETHEIPAIIEEFRQGAINAKEAGFDGVEIHGANGYLLDQFLQDKSNHRTDEYGGSIENRARLLLAVTDVVTSIWGASLTGVHLAPRGDLYSMGDSDSQGTFSYVARELGKRKLAFICAREGLEPAPRLGPLLKKEFGGVFIANEKFVQKSAQELLDAGEADAVAFGQLFIANPDLVSRFQKSAPINEPDPSTFYPSHERGYVDYPALKE